MSNYTTNADLVDDVLFRAGEPTDGTSDFQDAAVRYLNRSYQSVWRGGAELVPDVYEDWWWLRRYGQGQIIILPVYNTGTASVQNNLSTVTLSVGPQRSGSNISLTRAFFKVDNHPDVFRVNINTAGSTSVTLDSVYTGDTDTVAKFKVMFLDYALATDVASIISPMRVYQGDQNKIEGIDADTLWQKWPMEQCSPGVPQNFAECGIDSLGNRRVRFSHYGGTSDADLIRVDYSYTYRASDIADNSSEIEMPREWRKILCDFALYFLLLDKEDNRAAQALQLATGGLRAMSGAHRREMSVQSRNVGKINPRTGHMPNGRGPLRTEGGFIITSS